MKSLQADLDRALVRNEEKKNAAKYHMVRSLLLIVLRSFRRRVSPVETKSLLVVILPFRSSSSVSFFPPPRSVPQSRTSPLADPFLSLLPSSSFVLVASSLSSSSQQNDKSSSDD